MQGTAPREAPTELRCPRATPRRDGDVQAAARRIRDRRDAGGGAARWVRDLSIAWLVAVAGCGGGGGQPPDAGAVDAAPQIVDAPLAGLTVRVQDAPAQISFVDPSGSVFLAGMPGDAAAPFGAAAFRNATFTWQEGLGNFRFMEDAEPWRSVERFTDIEATAERVTFSFAGGAGVIEEVGEHTIKVTLRRDGADRATIAFACGPDEHFLGFGAQTHDVDHRGHTFPMFVTEQGNGKVPVDEQPDNWFIRGTRHQTGVAIPFFLSSAGYGILGATERRSVWSLCDPDEHPDAWRYEAWEPEATLYVFYGPAPLDVIRRHTDLIGRRQAPPPFVFGPWNDAVGGSASVREVAAVLRDNDIPSSAIWTEDWAGSSGDATNLFLDHNWTPSDTLYPDFSALADELHDAGFKFLGYFSTFAYVDNPGAGYMSDHYQEGVAGGYFVTDDTGATATFSAPRLGLAATLVDLTNPAAVDWMAGYMAAAIDAGLDGWMADYGEWMRLDVHNAAGLDPLVAHNRYPVLWQQLNERVLGERTDGVDRIAFVRSGYTGSQAIDHIVFWGADQATMFEPNDGLPTVLPIGIGLGVSGIPYYGSDIAGYSEWSSDAEGVQGNTNPPSTKELFFRWTTVGALSPIMRTHHGRRAAENWNFRRDADTLAHWKRWAMWHTQLYPYLASLAETAAATGAPLMRAMALAFPDDDRAWTPTDQFLLGDRLLVAPVVVEGATSRDVYLPADTWLPIDGGEPVAGPVTISVDAPVTEIPLYARAGTVLVLLPDTIESLAPATRGDVVTLADVGDDREVRVYLGADGAFEEVGGQLRYALDHERVPGAGVTLTYDGVALAECGTTPDPPCARVDEAGRSAAAWVTGPGTLAIADASGAAASLVVDGGAATRSLLVRVYW